VAVVGHRRGAAAAAFFFESDDFFLYIGVSPDIKAIMMSSRRCADDFPRENSKFNQQP
jgi:hypothetical protein